MGQCGHPSWRYHNGSCYMLVKSTPMTVNEAVVFCKAEGAILVNIQNVAENLFVTGLNPNEDMWIGFRRTEEDVTYTWIDTGKTQSYYNWSPGNPDGQPSKYKGDTVYCALIHGKQNGLWDDRDCFDRKSFVCEKSKKTRSML